MDFKYILKKLTKITLLVILFFLYVSGLQCEEKRVKVTAEIANIYLQPNINSTIIETVKRDSVLTLVSESTVRGRWYYVVFTSESGITKTGYIQASLAELTNLPPKIIKEKKKEPVQKKEQEVYIPPKKIRIIADNARIILEPNLESQVVRQVSIGDIFQSGAKVEEWYQIILPPDEEGKVVFGYIHQSFIEEVAEKATEVPKVKEKKTKAPPPPPRPIVPKKVESQREKEMKPETDKKIKASIKARYHYFNPTEKSFKDIYSGGTAIGGEINIKLWKFIDLWLIGSYYSKKGRLPFTKETTKMTLIPIGGGPKIRLKSGTISPYIGFGPVIYSYREENPIDLAKGTKVGIIGQAGCYINVIGGLLLDVCMDYSYCSVKPQRIKADIGGLKVGIGLGYEF